MTQKQLLETIKQLKDEKELKKNTQLFLEYLVTSLLQDKNLDNVFWGYIFNFISREVDFSLPAPMAVGFHNNNFTLYINPKRIDNSWNVENLRAILLHEGYHLLYKHLTIFNNEINENRSAVNIATDCEINQYIKNLPNGCITLEYVSSLVGKELEAKAGSLYYYEAIKNKPLDKESGNNLTDNNRHDKWNETKGDNNSFIAPDEVLNKLVNNILDKIETNGGKIRGNMSQNLIEQIEKLNEKPQIKWQSLVKKIMGRTVYGKEETINRLNRRFPKLIHKRGIIDSFINPVVFAIDTSGSISNKDLSYFINELKGLIKQTKLPITFIQFDAEITSVTNYDINHNKIDYVVEGRGGTQFQPLFDYLKEERVDPNTNIFILTDGYGEHTINTRGFNNYNWIITSDGNLSVKNNKKPIISLKTS